MTNYFYNLPDELQMYIFEFDPSYIDNFKDNLKNVNKEFYKGGFRNRKLNKVQYVKDQFRWCLLNCSTMASEPNRLEPANFDKCLEVKSWLKNIKLFNSTTTRQMKAL